MCNKSTPMINAILVLVVNGTDKASKNISQGVNHSEGGYVGTALSGLSHIEAATADRKVEHMENPHWGREWSRNCIVGPM